MKEMTMLELANIDLGDLCTALEDHSDEHHWWIDPNTGEIGLSSPYIDEFESTDELEERGVVWIQSMDSHEGYGDLQDFTARVRDPRAREMLERAIAGRGAFRRFKDTLFEFEELRKAWFAFHDARMQRRALDWLSDAKLVDPAEAERAAALHPDPDLPEISGAFDAFEIARAVAADLKQLYGDRLKEVILFGSWARGDAHPESDIDLLVVLDTVESRRTEDRRMEDVTWEQSLAHETLISPLAVSVQDYADGELPVVRAAAKQGKRVT